VIDECERKQIARGWCSMHWKRLHRVPLVCSQCLVEFMGHNGGKSSRRYCSTRCEGDAKTERYTGVLRSKHGPPEPRRCTCGSFIDVMSRKHYCDACKAHKQRIQGIKNRRRARKKTRDESRAAREKNPVYCRGCGNAVPRRRRAWCSDRCLTKAISNQDNHRRRGAYGKRKLFTLKEIGDRDGWVCHLCTSDVDPDAKGRQAPTMDHLIPVSLNGKHTMSNVRLAHMICNSRRGNRLLA
jgi:hypothetical protein